MRNKSRISRDEEEEMKRIYSVRSHYADNFAFTILPSGAVRFTFMEGDSSLDIKYPICAVVIELSNVLKYHQMLGMLLDKMREVGMLPKEETKTKESSEDERPESDQADIND